MKMLVTMIIDGDDEFQSNILEQALDMIPDAIEVKEITDYDITKIKQGDVRREEYFSAVRKVLNKIVKA